MRNNDKNTVSNSGTVMTVLQIIFLVLKLTGVIDWPWIWVLSPLWIGLALSVLSFIILAIYVWIVRMINK